MTQSLLSKNALAFKNNKRYIINSGGSRSGKTFNILNLAIAIMLENDGVFSIVSETHPHLRRGAIRDFQTILEGSGSWHPELWNKTESVYKFRENSMIEFFSCDSPGKVHGPARKFLFINEAQNISHEVFRQLAVRTTDNIFIDFNPTHEFWAHTGLKNLPETEWIHSTYLDNPYLSTEQIKEIERGKSDKYWWSVYGLGEIGRLDGVIFTNWIENEFPDQPKDLIFGLDFGFTNDPTSLVKIAFNSGEIWLDEVIYQTGLTNADISNIMRSKGILQTETIIADCAEPKSIEELHRAGWNIKPATKGADSVMAGIQLMQQYKINITKNSTNLIKEFRNYHWQKDKNDQKLNKPIDMWNHGVDAVRYAVTNKLTKRTTVGMVWR